MPVRSAWLVIAGAALLAGCGMLSRREAPAPEAPPPAQPGTPKGAYYKDDGPGERSGAQLAAVPDAVPRAEPLHRFANRPYQVFGRDYVPLTSIGPFRQRGVGSWYGRRFHGQATSSGEPYDMYAMTAAHPLLPIPSYARVTNLASGRSVVVRVNDRGPFHAERIIDLSYAAAHRLGYAEAGSALLQVEAIIPGTAVASAVPPPPAPEATPIPATARAAPLATEPPSASATSPGAPQQAGVYLQLGAFAARANAEALRERIARELAWLAQALQILAADGLFRLHAGPYRSHEEARTIAERIRSELSVQPLVVVR
jgi:rare lipoprotein A